MAINTIINDKSVLIAGDSEFFTGYIPDGDVHFLPKFKILFLFNLI